MKLIILIQSCDKERFKTQVIAQKRAIIRQIERFNLTNNISVYDYIGGYDKTYLKNSTIYINCDDSLTGTYEKTMNCFEYVNNNFDYDIILRINTSTFVNVFLLNSLLNILFHNMFSSDSELILCGDLSLKHLFMCPAPKHIGIRGNSMMFTNKIINVLLENRNNFINNEKYPLAGNIIKDDGHIIFGIDDVCISSILNIYFENKNDNILNHIFFYNHLYTYNMFNNVNFYKDNETQNRLYNLLKSYVTINIKRDEKLGDEETHLEDIILLDDLFRENIDNNIKKNIKLQFYKNNNVLIFRGFEYKQQFITYTRNFMDMDANV